MPKLLRKTVLPWTCSVAVHAFLLGLLTVSFANTEPVVAPPTPIAIEATVVDQRRIDEEIARLEAAEDQRRREREADQRREEERADAVRREQEREQQRIADQARQRKEREAADQRERELARQREEQQAAREEQERIAREREAAEQARRDEEQRVAAEQGQREEEQRQARAAAAARKQAELEEGLRREIEEADRRRLAELSGDLARYKTLIRQKVERNWVRPASALPGLNCEVAVRQIPGGEVVDVRIGLCNGDAAVTRSIEAAVYKASPLPQPPDPSLFERNLVFKFQPE